MTSNKDKCFDCEVFKNHEQREGVFALGFFCPLKNSFTLRNDDSCEWVVSDELPF